jgi:nitrite reductase/ring-hydroxylating ferredoxin subunit/uncharacterized membrane protein
MAGRPEEGGMGSVLHAAMNTLGRQTWLDRIAEPLAKGVGAAYRAGGPAGRQAMDLMHGTWLGHPLHPAVIIMPAGGWTAAVALDALELATGREELRAGADAAIGVGVAGATVAAVTGLTDWHHTEGETRRMGVVHGTLNSAALALFVASLAARNKGARGMGRTLALLGYGIATAAAYIGGHLSYDKRVGVNHADGQAPTDEWKAVLGEEQLQEGTPFRIYYNDVPVVLVRAGGRVHALAATCSHLGGPLDEGAVEDGSIVCPWHGSCFALNSGEVRRGPATYQQPRFGVRIRDGRIEIGPSDQTRTEAAEPRPERTAPAVGDGVRRSETVAASPR